MIALAAGGAWYFGQRRIPAPPNAFLFGPVTACRSLPGFAQTQGFNSTSVIDSQGAQKGLVLYEPAARAGDPPSKSFSDPTWTAAGYLGALTTDRAGNIYTSPAPRVSLLDNPVDKATTIYKVDTKSGKMAEFLALPGSSQVGPDNPFGILGLAYDCDTNSLYASSVAGSTRTTEAGAIYRVDLTTGQVAARLGNVDAFGLGVFNGVSGKRLYFGSARTSDIRSVALDIHGDFAGTARSELTLAGLGRNGDDKAQRLIFNADGSLTVRGLPFEYNLIATSERPQTLYTLRYSRQSDTWQFSGGS